MGRSRGAKELKVNQFGRNRMAVFTEGRMPEDQGREKRDSRNLGFAKILLGEFLLFPSTLIIATTTPTPHTHRENFEINKRLACRGERCNSIEIFHL